MLMNEIKDLIKEELIQYIIKESKMELNHLKNNISNSTITGKSWNKLIDQLGDVINEIKDFNSQYSSPIHGPLPNTSTALLKAKEIISILQEIKPVIIGMDSIERKENSIY